MSFDAPAAQRALDEAASIECADPRLPLMVDVTRLRLGDTQGSDPHTMLAEALDLQQRALDQGDFANVATAGALTEIARLRLGDTQRGPDVDRYLALARRGGDVRVEAVLGAIRTSFAMATASMDEADRISLEAQQQTPPVAIAFAAAGRLVQLSVIRREQLRLRELEGVIDALLSTSPRSGLGGLRASVQLELGDTEAARAALATFRATLPTLTRDWGHDAALVFGIDAAYDLAEPDDACEMARRLEATAGRVVVAVNGLVVLGRADRYLGRAAQLQGDLDGAIERFARARELDDASGCTLWAAWARHDEARARSERARRDDRDVASALTAEAAPVARRYGSRRLAEALRRLD
jgi:tetratricopeptide (TPR) repeat protein